MSTIIHYFHWGIYLGSFASLLALLTPYRRIGGLYIGTLFLTQAAFHGCIVVDLENYYRGLEVLPLLQNGLLTDRFTSDINGQIFISWIISLSAFAIIYEKKEAVSDPLY